MKGTDETQGRDPEVTSRIMSAVRNKDTRPEMAVRRLLWARGWRYRLHVKGLPGRPDMIFRRERVAVFIDGDFWHGNAWRIRGLDRLEDLFPTRTEWWTAKIRRNMERDKEVTSALEQSGWVVLRYWESDVLKSAPAVVESIEAALQERRRY